MATDTATRSKDTSQVDLVRLQLSELVGKDLKLFSPNVPGRLLRAKVLSAADNRVSLSKAGCDSEILNRLANESLVVQFPYKNQDISVNAKVSIGEGMNFGVQFERQVTPLARRKFTRIPRECEVKLAAFSLQALEGVDGKELKWMDCKTVNFSSGGVLVKTPRLLEVHSNLLLNIEIESELLPSLVLGDVRFCFLDESNRYQAGIEFIVREVAGRVFSQSALTQLPPAILKYSVKDRAELNRQIIEGAAKEH